MGGQILTMACSCQGGRVGAMNTQGRLIFLFRHADKEMSSGSNPLLSRTGREQAAQLKKLCLENKIPAPQKIWVSPKVRTRESMEPCSQIHQVECEILSDLSERLINESRSDFEGRIRRVLALATLEKGPLFICTHYDWLEEGFAFIATPEDQPSPSYFSWHPMSYMGFEIIEDRWHFFTKGQVRP